MTKGYSPFSPGQPVPSEFFVGRIPEIERLRNSAGAAAAGRLQVAFLDGERGIGKSSLASMVRFLAERDQQLLGIHAFLGGVSSLEEMARRVFDRLLKDSVDQAWHEQIRKYSAILKPAVAPTGSTTVFTMFTSGSKRNGPGTTGAPDTSGEAA